MAGKQHKAIIIGPIVSRRSLALSLALGLSWAPPERGQGEIYLYINCRQLEGNLRKPNELP